MTCLQGSLPYARTAVKRMRKVAEQETLFFAPIFRKEADNMPQKHLLRRLRVPPGRCGARFRKAGQHHQNLKKLLGKDNSL